MAQAANAKEATERAGIEEQEYLDYIDVMLQGKGGVYWGLYEYTPTEYHLVFNTTGNLADGYTQEQLIEKSDNISNGCNYIEIEPEVYTSDQKWVPYVDLIKKAIIEEKIYPMSTGYYFYRLSELTEIEGIENINTSQTTSMIYMFGYCENLTSIDLSSFNTKNVRDMSYLFYYCTGLTSLNISNLNTSNVENMRNMFARCTALTSLDVSNFDTRKVTNMTSLFYQCTGLTNLNLKNFDTSNVEKINSIFWGCSSLTDLDVTNFNTEKFERLNNVFRECSNLTTLDISNFNTTHITEMNSTFRDCSNLVTIYVGDNWSTNEVEDGTRMFYKCNNIEGGAGTTYIDSSIEYARIDGGEGAPGYFTYKAQSI